MAIYLGVDCGATHLRMGIIDDQGNLQSQKRLRSPLKHEPEKLPQIVKDQLTFTREQLAGVGVGVPGPIDFEKGLLLPSSNLGNVAPIPILKKFESIFGKKVILDRDTNLALLGEVWKGAAIGFKNVIMLTLGSGVGGAIMEDCQIERGTSGKAGEIGHMYMDLRAGNVVSGNLPSSTNLVPNSAIPTCGLGHEGCFEAFINTAKDLDELSLYLGYGLANLVDIFNPELIVIGGGKLMLGDFLPKAVLKMKEVGMKPAVDEVMVKYATLKEWSGVYGAAKLAADS